MASKSERNEIKGYLGRLRKATELAMDDNLKEMYFDLVDELEILEENFVEKDFSCTTSLQDIITRLKRLAADTDSYERSSGSEVDHAILLTEVEETMVSIADYRLLCGY